MDDLYSEYDEQLFDDQDEQDAMFDEEEDYDEQSSFDEEDYDEDVDDMLDALTEEDGDYPDDLSEITRGRRRRMRRRMMRRKRRKAVPRAKGGSAYRRPTTAGLVTHKQFKSALARVNGGQRRNAAGIRTLTTRARSADKRISAVTSVNRIQSQRIAALQTQQKIDGALDIAQAWSPDGQIDLFPLMRGVIKSGFLGAPKGLLANPLVIGGVGVLLRQDEEGNTVLSNFLGGSVK